MFHYRDKSEFVQSIQAEKKERLSIISTNFSNIFNVIIIILGKKKSAIVITN